MSQHPDVMTVLKWMLTILSTCCTLQERQVEETFSSSYALISPFLHNKLVKVLVASFVHTVAFTHTRMSAPWLSPMTLNFMGDEHASSLLSNFILEIKSFLGNPKGIVHPTGSHAVVNKWTMKSIYGME